MKPKVFVDTDVCLDLLLDRKPFNASATKLFSRAHRGKISISVSALSFTNMDYVIRAQYKIFESRKFIARFKPLVNVLAVNDTIIDLALASDFSDFEDAVQYYTATENGISILLTRNLRDYKSANIEVMTPESFLARMKN